MRIAGLVLCGGRSRRFGSEKAVARLEGRPLLAHVAVVLARGCDRVAISAPAASAAAAWARANGLEVVSDDHADPGGPLLGVVAGLRWMRGREMELLITAPCDLPRLPDDFAQRLAASIGGAPGAVACDAEGRMHPLCALWRPQAEPALKNVVASRRHPPLRFLLRDLAFAAVVFAEQGAFANVNTARDLEAMQIGLAAETP